MRYHARCPSGPAFPRSLPVIDDAESVGDARVHELGDVLGLVVLGVRELVGLTLTGQGAVDVQLVLLVSREIRSGPHNRRAIQLRFLTDVAVLILVLPDAEPALQGQALGRVTRLHRQPLDPAGVPIPPPQPRTHPPHPTQNPCPPPPSPL